MISKLKSSGNGVTQAQMIEQSPYDQEENVMALMARICAATQSDVANRYWRTIRDAIDKKVGLESLGKFLDEYRWNLSNHDFQSDLMNRCGDLLQCLSMHENSEYTRIVVAGGFSSGKSSFLNRLTNSVNLLPTGVEPISVVKTYLYCSNNTKALSVMGVNPRNVLVALPTDVLQAIQHAKKSNVYLAAVLDKLFVNLPAGTDLHGVAFIDTPGYNNSDIVTSQGKTDRQTAVEALSEGDVLFWLIDCERGTTVTGDIEMIRQFRGKKVFIFNKADKKGQREAQSIVEQAALSLYKEFPKEEIIDILAYSTLDNEVYYSKNNMTIASIVKAVKQATQGMTDDVTNCVQSIYNLFTHEIELSQAYLENIKAEYDKAVEEKYDAQQRLKNRKCEADNHLNEIREICIYSYDSIAEYARVLREGVKLVDSFIYKVYRYNEGRLSPSSALRAITNEMEDEAKDWKKKIEAVQVNYYEEGFRRNRVEILKEVLKESVMLSERSYEEACATCDNWLEKQNKETFLIQALTQYRDTFIAAIQSAIKQYNQHRTITYVG